MLQSFTLRNFKLFDKQGVTIEPGKITVLIGANGTGKSSFLQALYLLKQSVGQPALQISGSLIDLGSYTDIVHEHDASSNVGVSMVASYDDFDVNRRLRPLISASGTFEWSTTLAPNVIEQRGSVGGPTSGRRIEIDWHRERLERVVEEIRVGQSGVLTISGSGQIAYPIVLEGSSYATEDSNRMRLVDQKIRLLLGTVVRLLNCYYLIPAIRGFDRLAYDISMEDLPTDLTAAGGAGEQAALVVNYLASRLELADRVASWLEAVLDGSGRLWTRVVRGRLSGETVASGAGVNLLNEAFGRNQLVPLLLWLGMTPRGAVLGIEEPEIHLHPRAQVALCDVFVDVAKTEAKQLMLTTHSEHVLMGLLTAVADGRLSPADLAVYELRREGSASRAERLEVNEYGQIAGGLGGFLEVDVDQLGKLIEARFGNEAQLRPR